MHACIGEGDGNLLQCSCLENPRIRGTWWAAVYGDTQSWTWLKRLSSSIRQHIKKLRDYVASKGPSSQSYGFFCSHVWMWELDYKESWALKNWCFWTVLLEKTLQSSLNARRSDHSILKEIRPEYSLEGWMLRLQYFAHLMRRADSGKDPDAGKDWREEEKGTTENERVGWQHRLNGHEFKQTLWVGDAIKPSHPL